MMHARRLGAVFIAIALTAAPATAQTAVRSNAAPSRAGTLSVVGTATIEKAPDRATLSFSVITNADNAAAASADNNIRYEAIRSRLVVAGIPATAIATRGYSIGYNARPAAPDPRYAQRYGYVVNRNVLVTIDDVTKAGAAVDAAVQGGVTDVGGITFGFRDPRAVQREALAAAYADAEAQAQTLARSGRFALGAPLMVGNPPRTVADGVFQPIQTADTYTIRSAAAAAPPPPTVVPAQPISVSASIPVTWRIAP